MVLGNVRSGFEGDIDGFGIVWSLFFGGMKMVTMMMKKVVVVGIFRDIRGF